MIVMALTAGMITSCGGDDPIDPPAPVDPDDPNNPDDPDNPDNPDKAPTWKVDNAQQYGETMSMWVRTEQGGSTDALALFYGSQCRGTATMVLSDSQGQLWCLLVYGTGEETGNLTLKYWNSKKKKIYTQERFCSFSADSQHGTPDNPVSVKF